MTAGSSPAAPVVLAQGAVSFKEVQGRRSHEFDREAGKFFERSKSGTGEGSLEFPGRITFLHNGGYRSYRHIGSFHRCD